MTPADCVDQGSSCLTMISLAGFLTVSFPEGYCTKMMCQNDTQCPSGAGCETTTSTCLQKCTRNNECRTAQGYSCATSPLGGTANYCLPPDITNLIGGGGQTAGNLGGLFGGAGGTQGGFLAGLGGLLGGGAAGAGGTTR
jgi:hypothetical protein